MAKNKRQLVSLLSLALYLALLSRRDCDAARILAIWHFDGRSHVNVLQPVAKALAAAGHRVDVVSHYPLRERFPNYTDLIELPLRGTRNFAWQDLGPKQELDWIMRTTRDICRQLGDPRLARLIKNPPKDPPYDLILLHVIVGFQCFSAIGHLWDVPIVGVSTTRLYLEDKLVVADPPNLATAPGHCLFHRAELSFWERLENVWLAYRDLSLEYPERMALQRELVDEYLGPGLPSFDEMRRNVALVLSNSHFSYYGAQPKVPAVVEIGGIHVHRTREEEKKNATAPIVDPGLKRFMDESRDGFLYFSFGSLMALETLPSDILHSFYEAFETVAPVRVIMKVADPELLPSDVPKNVLTATWLPQQQILQHKNLRAFVTHGGGLGSQEAIYHHAPMLCVPFFAEQRINCDILVAKGVAVKLDVRQAQHQDYHRALHEILSNHRRYKTAMRAFCDQFWDRPGEASSPQKLVVYWVEYVLRHGRHALQSPAVKLHWWQAQLLDVYGFLVAAALAALALLVAALRFLLLLSRIVVRRSRCRKRGNDVSTAAAAVDSKKSQ
ncbi:hypothetical protein TKK_0014398 [Trichogramma kaykai]